MKWHVEEIPDLKGYAIEWAEPGKYYLSRRNRIFSAETLKPPFKPVAKIEAPMWQQAASTFRLAQRLLRFMVTNIIDLGNHELFITFDKSVGIIRKGKFHGLKGIARPCRVLRSGCAVDGNGDVYFGEYLPNTDRGEMSIYRYRCGTDRAEIAYTFPPNSIRHIHGIYFDYLTGALFCLTGDKGSECRILRTFDGFNSVETVGEGDESWRAVSILFDSESFLYGTDAEYRENEVFRIDRKTTERTAVGKVNGTVFYSKKLENDLFFATTAENAPSQAENVASLWRVDSMGNCEKLVSFQKDIWHTAIFMFGTIHFPYKNAFDDRLFFNLVGVKGDNRVFCLKK